MNENYINNKFCQVQNVTGEAPFRVFAGSFCVSPSAQGYVLNYSADGKNWTADVNEMPANETHNFWGITPGMYFKLVGNTDTVTVMSAKKQ